MLEVCSNVQWSNNLRKVQWKICYVIISVYYIKNNHFNYLNNFNNFHSSQSAYTAIFQNRQNYEKILLSNNGSNYARAFLTAYMILEISFLTCFNYKLFFTLKKNCAKCKKYHLKLKLNIYEPFKFSGKFSLIS